MRSYKSNEANSMYVSMYVLFEDGWLSYVYRIGIKLPIFHQSKSRQVSEVLSLFPGDNSPIRYVIDCMRYLSMVILKSGGWPQLIGLIDHAV